MLRIFLLSILFFSHTTDSTLPPAGAHLLHVAQGNGMQIYECMQQGSEFEWVFRAPEARLFDLSTHKQVATHGAGPMWTWEDGSSVGGQVLAKSPSPDPSSIPWLLLSVTPSGNPSGALSKVTLVRRSDTHGGNAPSHGCNAQSAGHIVRVPYKASYTFYSTQ